MFPFLVSQSVERDQTSDKKTHPELSDLFSHKLQESELSLHAMEDIYGANAPLSNMVEPQKI